MFALGLLSSASPLLAQQAATRWTPSINVGAALPRGDVRSFTNTGYTDGVALDVAGAFPVGLRAEAGYTHFSFTYPDRYTQGTHFDGKRNQYNGGLDLVLPVHTRFVTPYLIGGAGFYHLSVHENCEALMLPDASAATTPTCAGDESAHLGWSGGVGFDLPGGFLGSRIEARYTKIPIPGGAYSYVPLTFALRF